MAPIFVSSSAACGNCGPCVQRSAENGRPPVDKALLALGVPRFLHPETRVCEGAPAEGQRAASATDDCILEATVGGDGPKSLLRSGSAPTVAEVLAAPADWFKPNADLGRIGVEQVDGEHFHLLSTVPGGCIDFKSFVTIASKIFREEGAHVEEFSLADLDAALDAHCAFGCLGARDGIRNGYGGGDFSHFDPYAFGAAEFLRMGIGGDKHRVHLGTSDCCEAGRKQWPLDSSPIAATGARNKFFHRSSYGDVEHFLVTECGDFSEGECVVNLVDSGSVLVPVHCTPERGRHVSILSPVNSQLCVPVGARAEVHGATFAPTKRPVVLTFSGAMRVKFLESSFNPEVVWARRMSCENLDDFWDTDVHPCSTFARFFTKSGARVMAINGFYDVDTSARSVPGYALDDSVWSEEDPCPPGCSVYEALWSHRKLILYGDRLGTSYECLTNSMAFGPVTLQKGQPIAMAPNLFAMVAFSQPERIRVVTGVDAYELDDGGLSADDDDFPAEY